MELDLEKLLDHAGKLFNVNRSTIIVSTDFPSFPVELTEKALLCAVVVFLIAKELLFAGTLPAAVNGTSTTDCRRTIATDLVRYYSTQVP